jgi:hypothetical protein
MLFLLLAGENPTPEKKKEVEEYWAKRNVVFHSWRHFYASRMTDKLEARKVMLATGHKTESVFKGYSDHALESDLMDVAELPEKFSAGYYQKKSMKVGQGDSKLLFLVKHLVETTQNLLLETVETKKSRKVLRSLLGAAIQPPSWVVVVD